jgi:serine/threonine protein kinase
VRCMIFTLSHLLPLIINEATTTMHKYRLISKKGEGTFSEVLKAQSIKTGKYVAIK